jgi:hypothetical protein
MFKFPSMHFPSIHFPKFPKLSSKDFSGGKATMSTTEFHCVNGTCDGKVKFQFRLTFFVILALIIHIRNYFWSGVRPVFLFSYQTQCFIF